MRFDIEIQSDPLKLVYIEAGKEIDSSLVPILYVHTKDINLIPSDILTIDNTSIISGLRESPIMMSSFSDNKMLNIESDKLLLTHIALYSKATNTKTPVFYNHKINIKKYNSNAKFSEQSIIIYTHTGDVIDKNLYIIEYSNDYAYVYINPIPNTILFIQWSDSFNIYNEMLKLSLVYTDKGSNYTTSNLGIFEYCSVLNSDKKTYTVYLGKSAGVLYYKVNGSQDIILPPAANMNDKWNLLIDNILLFSTDKDGVPCSYRLPEYYIQKQNDANNLTGDYRYKKYENQICKILNSSFVKLQMQPSNAKLNDVQIYIKSKYDNTITYAYTSNESLIGKIAYGTTIVFQKISDYSYNGIFQLSSDVDINNYYAEATYYIDNKYYEYRGLNLKTISLDSTRLIGLFIEPTYNYNDTDQIKLYYAYVGGTLNYIDGKFNRSFDSKSSYEEYIKESSYLHLAYISIDASKLVDKLEVIPCSSINTNNPFLDDAENINYADRLFSKNLIERNMSLQLNDTACMYINSSIFKEEFTDTDIDIYINYAKQIAKENATISTKVIATKDLINNGIIPSLIVTPTQVTTTTTTFSGTAIPLDPILKQTTTTTTTTTKSPYDNQVPFSWFDATIEDMWIPEVEDPDLDDSDPQKWGAVWNGSGWNAWICYCDYSEVWMNINPNKWLKYKPLKMRVTYTGTDPDKITVNMYSYQDWRVGYGEDGYNEPYTYTIMQEIDIPYQDFDMNKIDIWVNSDTEFTIDKIEFYLSDEEYVLPTEYTITINPDPAIKFLGEGMGSNTYKGVLPITIVARLKSDYILTGITITDINGITYNINDCIINNEYEYAYSYSHFSVNIQSLPDLPSPEFTLNFIIENRI